MSGIGPYTDTLLNNDYDVLYNNNHPFSQYYDRMPLNHHQATEGSVVSDSEMFPSFTDPSFSQYLQCLVHFPPLLLLLKNY